MNYSRKERINHVVLDEEEDAAEACCKAYEIAVMVGEDPEHDDDCSRAGQNSDFCKYTLVRHRDARTDKQMEFGVEVAPVRTPELADRIIAAGGYLFSDEESADEVAHLESVPPDSEDDGWPHATGWFDWQVTVVLAKQGQPIYKHGFTSKAVQKAAKEVIRENGFGIPVATMLHEMQQLLGGGTERAGKLAILEIGYQIVKGKVVRP